MRLKWKLMVVSLKMFFRQREAIIWTLFLPLLMVTLFAFVQFDGVGRLEIGIVNNAGTAAEGLLRSLAAVKTLNVREGDRDGELRHLGKGERDLVLVIPSEYRLDGAVPLTAYVNEAKPQEAQLAMLILKQVLDEAAFSSFPEIERVGLRVEALKGRNLTYLDFLIPGVISMSIMQMGVFGVAFSFVSLKKRGILRRLSVTPLHPNDFILAQVAMRLLVVMLQMSLMVGAGLLFFNLHFLGSLVQMFLVGTLGAVTFLALGFAIAGVSKSEDQVAPLANIIAMPMMLLSGIFFNRSSLPGFVHVVTDYFPLTFLADSMRAIAIDGASLADVRSDVLGLGIWCVVMCLIATKMFRWE